MTIQACDYECKRSGCDHMSAATIDPAEPIKQKTIMLDFDGVIHSYARWTGEIPFDPPVPGAIDFMRWANEEGYTIVIYSARARTKEGVFGIQQWLKYHGYDKAIKVTDRKVGCELYVDDRGYRFTGEFEELQTLLKNPELLRPWNK